MPRSNAAYNVALGDTAGKSGFQSLLQIGLFRLFVALFTFQRVYRSFQYFARTVVPSTRHQPLGKFIKPL